MRAVSALSVAVVVLLGILSACYDHASAAGPCVCDEETALEMRGISSTPSNHNTVMVFLHVGLQNSKECICCPNLTLAYRYCAWSNGYAVPKNISTPESTHALPWSPWIPDNPLCLRRPLTISIANLSSNHYYRFQVAPLSTGLGPITKLKYFGSQAIPMIHKIPSKRVRVNDSFSIICDVSGSPMPEVYWTKSLSCLHPLNNQMGNTLRFEHIQLYHACTYTCFASNWQLNNGNLESAYDQMDVTIQVIAVGPSSSISSTSATTTTVVSSTLPNRTLSNEWSIAATASPQVTSALPTKEILIQALIPATIALTIIVLLCLLISVAVLWKKYKKTRFMTVPNILHCSPLSKLPCHSPIVNNDYYFHSYIGEYSNRILRIPTENLRVMGTIGEGKFATVCCAWARDIPHAGQETMVAVKKLKPDVGLSGEVLKALCHEAKLMCRLDHKHIVKFYGIHVSQDHLIPTMLIYEYMAEGDLRAFLLRKAEVKRASGTAQRQRSLSTSSAYECQNAGLSTLELVEICLQVAQGMQYLIEQQHLHRDLAARNCLVGRNLLVKISDLGMGQSLYGKNYYRMNQPGYVPVKWMSPEALLNGIFSQYSDVWSFGVLMWEVFTFGQEPYTGKSCEEVVQLFQRQNAKGVSVSLAQPSMCPGLVYSIMRHCWSIQKEERPSFRLLVDALNNWLVNRQCYDNDFETTV